VDTSRPSPRTNWTHLVPPPVLIRTWGVCGARAADLMRNHRMSPATAKKTKTRLTPSTMACAGRRVRPRPDWQTKVGPAERQTGACSPFPPGGRHARGRTWLYCGLHMLCGTSIAVQLPPAGRPHRTCSTPHMGGHEQTCRARRAVTGAPPPPPRPGAAQRACRTRAGMWVWIPPLSSTLD